MQRNMKRVFLWKTMEMMDTIYWCSDARSAHINIDKIRIDKHSSSKLLH